MVYQSPEISKKLYTNDIIYRPPLEADSILLEVAIGCSYSQCYFCREQAAQRFTLIPADLVKERIELIATLPQNRHKQTLFLVGENNLVLSMRRLSEILAHIQQHLPWVKHVNLYGRAKDVLAKSKADLLALKNLGLTHVYVGIESGSDRVLSLINKGETTKEMKQALDLLDEVGLSYELSSVIGLGGKPYSGENAIKTAEFYNQVHPHSIRLMTLNPEPGTKIKQMIEADEFEQLSPWESVLEERLFLSRLEVQNCLVAGNHFTNMIPFVVNWPEHKQVVLDKIDEIIASIGPEDLHYQHFDHM